MQGSVTVSFISWMERCQVLYQVLWKPSEKFHHRKRDKKGRISVQQNKSIYCCCIPKPIGASSNSFVQKKKFSWDFSQCHLLYREESGASQFFKEYWGTTVHWGQKGSIHLHWVDILYWLCQKIHLFMLPYITVFVK